MTKLISVLCGVFLACIFQATVPAQTITSQPQSITVNNASTATFTVGASNALTYQWQFNGSNIDGATSSALTLEDVMTNEQGNYTVVVSSTNSSVTSSPPAVLTIVSGTIVRFTLSGLLPGAPASNIDVQLFDHDKPATVENFIHYIIAGGYTNMFFDRCSPQFVLQGGDYGASNRTSTSPPVTGWSVESIFTYGSNQPTPPYPPQVDSEFNVGPLIHNRFGTIAMALAGGDQDSANSAFFFNLTDNSANLDSQSGGFTVFGRILDATNVLQYFYGLSVGNGILSSSAFLEDGVLTSNLSTLPVNYTGTSNAANANLVFCDFSFPFGAPVPDTTPPTVALTNPAPGALLTNYLAGTASDNVGLAVVITVLTPQETNAPFPYPYTNNASETNYATGTTNWSQGLNPGVYEVTAQAQDGAGNLSTAVTELITNTAVFIIGNGTVVFTNTSLTNVNPIGYPVQPYSNYGVQAIPGPNQTFVSWSDGTSTTTNEVLNFTWEGGVYTATFISNQSNGIAFTYPTPNATLVSSLFNITGTIATNVLTLPVTVTCQIFTNTTTNFAVTVPQSTTTSTTNWSIAVTNYLPGGSYFIQALATDKLGKQSLITENFTFTADTNPPTIAITNPVPGALLYLGGPMLLQGTASDSFVPLASVACTLVPVSNADGTVPNGGYSFTDDAVGTTNWSLDLNSLGYIPPGQYMFSAEAQDVVGNSNQTASQPLTLSAIQINGDGTVTLTQGGNIKTNPIGYPLQYGVTYGLQATPAAGHAFFNWTYQSSTVVASTVWSNFNYEGGLLTANFIPSSTPKGISITYPAQGEILQTNNFLLKGTVEGSVGVAQITCQLSSESSGLKVGPPMTTSGAKTWSVAVTNLPPDTYLVQAVGTNANGFSTVISEYFAVLAFKPIAGTYNGLFLCTTGPVTLTNSGLMTLTLADSGSYTAKLDFPAGPPAPTQYFFTPTGTSYSPYEILTQRPMDLDLSLDLTNGTDTLTGTLSARSGAWSSQVVCYRAVTKLSPHTTPATGKYVLNLVPTGSPETNGYATLAVSGGGVLALSGTLPDGASFSQSARVSTNGVWPLYAIPSGYKTNGVIMGWVTNQASGLCSGQLYWYKPPGDGAGYTSSIIPDANLTGTNYLAPAPGNYSIVFQGGSFTVPLTNQLTMARAGSQFKPLNPADKLSISISSSGVLTGHFVTATSSKPLQFKGAFFGQSQGGSGFILNGSSTAGYFVLTAQ